MENFNYLMFENDKNNCWLDAAIVLIANSKNIKEVIKTVSGSSQIEYIVSAYNNAQAILNDDNMPVPARFAEVRTKLREIQINTLFYLEKFLKFKTGEPESAFCALYTLFHQDDPRIKEIVNISWFWEKSCSNCGLNSKTSLFTRSIITLAKVTDYFQPASPTSTYICSCKTEQEMKLVYKELPSCLMFHFEKGAGKGSSIPLQFVIDAREYHLTGIVILEKGTEVNLNHFVTWVRQPSLDMWLNCNDLNMSVVKYSKTKPEMELKDLFMCLYEAFDDFGVIRHDVSVDDEQAENMNAELIYLSDEGEDLKNAPTIVVVKPSVCEQEPLGDKINNIADHPAENMLTEELDDCKEGNDTSQTSKIPDTENVSNPEELNIDKINNSNICMSSAGLFSGAIEHKIEEKDESLMKKTGIPNISEVKTTELDAKIETSTNPNPKSEVIEEPSVSIKSASDKCEEDDEDDHKMPLFHKILKNIFPNAFIELEETPKKNSRSSSLCLKNEENSALKKRKIAEKSSVPGTSKARVEPAPDPGGFDAKHTKKKKTLNGVSNGACGMVRKKMKKKGKNNDKHHKKIVHQKPTDDEAEFKKCVNDNAENVFGQFILAIFSKEFSNFYPSRNHKSLKK